MVVSNRNLLFQGSIFRGYVSFRDGIVRISYVLPLAHPCFPALTLRFLPPSVLFPHSPTLFFQHPCVFGMGFFLVQVKPQDSPPWEGGDKESLKVTFQSWLIWWYGWFQPHQKNTRPLGLWKFFGCYMGVSKNRGTLKWMVYNGKPYQNGWFGGTTIFGNIHMAISILTPCKGRFPRDQSSPTGVQEESLSSHCWSDISIGIS